MNTAPGRYLEMDERKRDEFKERLAFDPALTMSPERITVESPSIDPSTESSLELTESPDPAPASRLKRADSATVIAAFISGIVTEEELDKIEADAKSPAVVEIERKDSPINSPMGSAQGSPSVEAGRDEASFPVERVSSGHEVSPRPDEDESIRGTTTGLHIRDKLLGALPSPSSHDAEALEHDFKGTDETQE